jgi:CPA2 family monovalent cation:H+ antiporter-2
MKVGGTPPLLSQIITMVMMGFLLVGKWAGSKWTASLGVILSISSTTIILKNFDELGVKAQKFAGIVIGSPISCRTLLPF